MEPPDRPDDQALNSYEFMYHLRTVHQVVTDQLRMADQKAAYIFSFITAILIFWSADLKRGFSSIVAAQAISPVWLLSLAFVLALVYTIVCAILIVAPRSGASGSSLFWGSWPAAGEKLKSLKQDVTGYLANEYVQDIDALADICRKKFRFVGYAQRGFVATILLHIIILAVESR
jgi:Family of unknown function (DUF5706)